jgi:predicted metal-binding protein
MPLATSREGGWPQRKLNSASRETCQRMDYQPDGVFRRRVRPDGLPRPHPARKSEMTETVELLVCVTCERDGTDPEAPRPGRLLADALAGLLPEGVTLRETECLSNCTRGCTVALRGSGRWTYVYGNLSPDQAATVGEGAAKYRATADGLVPWRERPDHFRKNCIARVPPLEA